MSIPPNQLRRDHPWTRFVLLDLSAGPVRSQAKVTHSKSTNLSTRPVKQRNTSSVEVSVLLHVHSWIFFPFFFKDNVNERVTFACDRTGPADESKRTKRVQGWSRLNWLGGILIIVSWHIHFNKLLMPLRLYAALSIRCKVYNIIY